MAKKKRGRKPKSEKRKPLLTAGAIVSILQILFFTAAGLVLVSFSRQAVLAGINDALVGQFGWASIFVPFILLSFGFLFSKLKNPLSQPNVPVGMLLFFLSIAALTRSGEFGSSAWDGISALITNIGAFIVLFGTTAVGLIVLLNTSMDQLFLFISNILRKIRNFVAGESRPASSFRGAFSAGKKELKVLGGENYEQSSGNDGPVLSKQQLPNKNSVSRDDFESQPVSNTPGEDIVWKYPPLSLLQEGGGGKADRGNIKQNADVIEQTLDSFGITARVVEVHQGPAVTQYAIEVALGTKLSKITGLERDLALALAAPNGSIRIEAPIPGRSLVGIELPNKSPEFVNLKKMMTSEQMKSNDSKLLVALGLDVSGMPIVADIGKMPHVLIAGQTGSGKSVCLNTFLASILFRASPSEVKLILVDPKRVELTQYNDIPHLLTPVIVEPQKVVSALRWLTAEMERRYKLFSQVGARNIEAYNEMSGFQALPYIVLIVDELADVMLVSPSEVEETVTRLAQMSRATGIHMVLATQRPSVDVITGLIKANVPWRIAFAVSSLVDSRVILDSPGAEKLLGKGDMLYLSPQQAKPIRSQGAFTSDKEIVDLVNFLKSQGVRPQYSEEVTTMSSAHGVSSSHGMSAGDTDDLFAESVRLVCSADKASASLLQRRLSIGYARAARILDQLESAGVVGPSEGSKPRDILIKDPSEILGNQGGEQSTSS